MVMSLWEQVVGPLVAQKSWPEKVADGVLIVGVASHAWADQLHLLKPQILSRYRQLLGRSALKDVEFHVTRRRARKEDGETTVPALHPMSGETLPPSPVPGEVLDGVTNPEVRDLLGRSFARLRAAREWKREHGWARCGRCQRIFNGPKCPHCGGHPDVA
jgi:predicted nucleic acid-binding Zn ribbon protein